MAGGIKILRSLLQPTGKGAALYEKTLETCEHRHSDFIGYGLDLCALTQGRSARICVQSGYRPRLFYSDSTRIWRAESLPLSRCKKLWTSNVWRSAFSFLRVFAAGIPKRNLHTLFLVMLNETTKMENLCLLDFPDPADRRFGRMADQRRGRALSYRCKKAAPVSARHRLSHRMDSALSFYGDRYGADFPFYRQPQTQPLPEYFLDSAGLQFFVDDSIF